MQNLWTNLHSFGPEWLRTAVDLLVLFLIVYRILVAFRGTRALSMLWGFALVAAGFFIANYFQLATVEWLLGKFIQYSIFLIIIIFQHDIRRGLSRLGQTQFVRLVTGTKREPKYFDEIIKASVSLASKNVGALIVLERGMSLEHIINEGVALDAVVTKELLASIFMTTSPIHDGAVIVRGERLAAAGCVLPLTVNPNISRTLGTRHRAALGLTEETDAVALVVSEEQGKISLVIDGKITRDLDGATLKRVLHNLFFVPRRSLFDMGRN